MDFFNFIVVIIIIIFFMILNRFLLWNILYNRYMSLITITFTDMLEIMFFSKLNHLLLEKCHIQFHHLRTSCT